MSVPNVTFPLEQEQIKPTFTMLQKHLAGLNADVRMTQELIRTIRTFCAHPGRSQYTCSACGMSWDND